MASKENVETQTWVVASTASMREMRKSVSRGDDFISSQTTGGSLSTKLDAALLRAISLNVPLHCFGKVFTSQTKTPFAQQDYLKSKVVERLDDFISHDWSSGRYSKTIALCVIYNAPAAVLFSNILGCLLMVLQNKYLLGWLAISRPHQPDLPEAASAAVDHGTWAQLFCPLLYAFIFFCWQDVKSFFGFKCADVFVDKLCIDQEDREKKAKGILGLAGFLNHTNRMVICWSPRYFTRLWCTFEVASWLYLGKELSSVYFMPISIGGICVAYGCVCYFCTTGYHFVNVLQPSANAAVLLVTALSFPVFVHIFRRILHDLSRLPEQVNAFSITQAQCFCCTVNHVMPGTNEELPCDRKVVYKTVQDWFPTNNASATDEEKLRKFDVSVRELFGKFVLRTAGPTRFGIAMIVVTAAQPFLWRSWDIAAAIGTAASELHIKNIIRNITLGLCVAPGVLKLIAHVLVFLNGKVGFLKSSIADATLSLFAGLLLVLFPNVWFYVIYAMMNQEHSHYALVVFGSWVFCFLLYPENWPRLKYLINDRKDAADQQQQQQQQQQQEQQEQLQMQPVQEQHDIREKTSELAELWDDKMEVFRKTTFV